VQHAERDDLQKALQEAGIGTQIHYPIPPHLQEAYRDAGYAAGRFPIAESMGNRLLSLSMGPQLDDAGVTAVIIALKAAAHG
jgi:dTDP-4-amino-4,6-dideoxygalactose transaminase